MISLGKVLVAVVLLFFCGIVYRIASKRLGSVTAVLSVSLETFPLRIDNWVGHDVALSDAVRKVAGYDDFFNRRYLELDESYLGQMPDVAEQKVDVLIKKANRYANVYVGYSARPRTMVGHRPQVCYPANGWIHDNSESIKFTSHNGQVIPALLHRFHKPAPVSDETVVLNYYIVNGQPTNEQSVFTGLSWRAPNISGDAARYVTQVQINSNLESTVRLVAEKFSDSILSYFPNTTRQESVTAIE